MMLLMMLMLLYSHDKRQAVKVKQETINALVMMLSFLYNDDNDDVGHSSPG